jgi:hypothetical protein
MTSSYLGEGGADDWLLLLLLLISSLLLSSSPSSPQSSAAPFKEALFRFKTATSSLASAPVVLPFSSEIVDGWGGTTAGVNHPPIVT